ncbi:MarR family winged helix-turn-helix transcriptional regulator [Microlunatus endophyticus]|uniref:MarR family winged helix-turn-helix transcriptional regulator n=1 Tax=Microlunatus endophyticus TaxID=1716077 RepID=UPI00166B5720|nr:MarR family transcriptional regulator [Microlunatus endophyticus]
MSARLRGVVMRLSRQLNASATHEGLTPSQASALGLINGRGPLSLSELAAIEGLNPTMVSRIVGRLDELGLISRRQNPQDLRSAVVEITDQGRQTHDRVRGERAKVLSDCLEELSAAEQQAVVTALPALEALAEQLINSSTGQRDK